MKNTILLLYESWLNTTGNITGNDEIDEWIEQRNNDLEVQIEKISLNECSPWYYDEKEGQIRNQNLSFFTVKGFQRKRENDVILEQPVILQNEIGYLGIICKEIDGVLNFLMQAKIEPGNINKIQLSPTIQATKSNFTQKHGGRKPNYLEYFLNAVDHEIIVDQIQSEQSSRFYKKRNRNIIIKVQDEILLKPNFKWMTLGQIKRLMKKDNIVNMDTRTVLSCIPYYNHSFSTNELKAMEAKANDKSLFKSIFTMHDEYMIPRIYQQINNSKMFDDEEDALVSLDHLSTWKNTEKEMKCVHEHDFKVIFCDIMIEGREVTRWCQPLFEATGIALFGLFVCNDDGVKKFLVRIKKEIGCFDSLELGPTVQLEPSKIQNNQDQIVDLFMNKMNHNVDIIHDVLLSEEGGRFYHEQNRNVIIEINKNEIHAVEEEGYFWVSYRTLNQLVQVNNCLNIQLRNLISLLEV